MSSQNQFLLYTAPDGAVRVEVFFKDETVWLTQKALAELFGVKRRAITKHLLNIFSTGEVAEDSVCSILEHTAGGRENRVSTKSRCSMSNSPRTWFPEWLWRDMNFSHNC
jgi:hypothetical protein